MGFSALLKSAIAGFYCTTLLTRILSMEINEYLVTDVGDDAPGDKSTNQGPGDINKSKLQAPAVDPNNRSR